MYLININIISKREIDIVIYFTKLPSNAKPIGLLNNPQALPIVAVPSAVPANDNGSLEEFL